jgi:hypothetical protein
MILNTPSAAKRMLILFFRGNISLHSLLDSKGNLVVFISGLPTKLLSNNQRLIQNDNLFRF